MLEIASARVAAPSFRTHIVPPTIGRSTPPPQAHSSRPDLVRPSFVTAAERRRAEPPDATKVEPTGRSRHIREVSIRRLFAMVVTLALLFAPALTRAGEASAAGSNHHVQMMQSGHCKSGAARSSDDKSSDQAAGKTCCISMCMAVAVVPAIPAKSVSVHGTAARFAPANQYRGRIAELATPPPRLA